MASVCFLIKGQYLHLPSLVQIFGMGSVVTVSVGGKSMVELVMRSLKLGNLLYPIIGGLGNKSPQSVLLLIMFQFLIISFLISGLDGL